MERLISFLGLLCFIGLCWLISNNKKKVIWKPIIGGCALQFIFAILILKTPFGGVIFEKAKEFFNGVMAYSIEGAKFVFGPLADFGASAKAFGPAYGFIFAFQKTHYNRSRL